MTTTPVASERPSARLELMRFQSELKERLAAIPLRDIEIVNTTPAQKRKAGEAAPRNVRTQKTLTEALAATKRFVVQPIIKLPESSEMYYPVEGRNAVQWYASVPIMQEQFRDLVRYLCKQTISDKWDKNERIRFKRQLKTDGAQLSPEDAQSNAARLQCLRNIDHVRLHIATLASSILMNLTIADADEAVWREAQRTTTNTPNSNSMRVRETRVLLSHLMMHKKKERIITPLRDEKTCYTCDVALRDNQNAVLEFPNVAVRRFVDDPQKMLDFTLCSVCDNNFQQWDRLINFYDTVRDQAAAFCANTPQVSAADALTDMFIASYLDTALSVFNTLLTKVIEGFKLFLTTTTPEPAARACLQLLPDMFKPGDPRANPSQRPVAKLSDCAVKFGELMRTADRDDLLESIDVLVN